MFVKAGLVTLALALSISAGPVDLGSSIPLKAPNPLASKDGQFDKRVAARRIAYDRIKHRQNMINLEKNMGSDAFNKGGRIISLPQVGDGSPRRPSSRKRPQTYKPNKGGDHKEKREEEPLGEDAPSGRITIGAPEQPFLVDFDTASADLVVPSTQCNSILCESKHRYDATQSSTSDPELDIVTVAGIAVADQHFIAASSMHDHFADIVPDGILGLAFRSISSLDQDPWLANARQQRAIREHVFGLKLAPSGSELHLGAENPALYTGPIERHDVVGEGFWQIDAGEIRVGGAPVRQRLRTIVDSGTPFVYGPPGQVAELYSKIPDARVYDQKAGTYSFPCASEAAVVAFSWGGQEWAMSAESLRLGTTKDDATRCVGAVVGQDFGLGTNVWVLGERFLRNVYSVFDREENTVGFAELKKSLL